jgi:hypothetical protein
LPRKAEYARDKEIERQGAAQRDMDALQFFAALLAHAEPAAREHRKADDHQRNEKRRVDPVEPPCRRVPGAVGAQPLRAPDGWRRSSLWATTKIKHTAAVRRFDADQADISSRTPSAENRRRYNPANF